MDGRLLEAEAIFKLVEIAYAKEKADKQKKQRKKYKKIKKCYVIHWKGKGFYLNFDRAWVHHVENARRFSNRQMAEEMLDKQMKKAELEVLKMYL